MSSHWKREEVEAIVDDYLHMLTLELAGQTYNKTRHREALKHRLSDRSDGSIERKHQNISAAMIQLGCPFISGYKPLPNLQGLLADIVAERIALNDLFDKTALSAAERPATAPLQLEFDRVLDNPPALRLGTRERARPYLIRKQGIQRDYVEREARNRSLGIAGETFVVQYEHARLREFGQTKLADRVEHVSRTRGDGLGFDVLSYEVGGQERFIEVKTTSFGKETPFFVSRNEVEFSEEFPRQYHLYRLFEFRQAPRMFDLEGSVKHNCILDPMTFRASFT